MPLSDRFDLPQGTIVLWKIDETEAELRAFCTADECTAAATRFSTANRRREWLAWHAALRTIVPDAEPFYLPDGAPAIGEGLRIGVSHTRGYAAVIVGRTDSAVDIERRGRDFTAAEPRFLTDEERAIIAGGGGMLTSGIVWCAKETLYKLDAGENADLRRDIRITGFDPAGPTIDGSVRGRIHRLGMVPHTELHIVFGTTERQRDRRTDLPAPSDDE